MCVPSGIWPGHLILLILSSISTSWGLRNQMYEPIGGGHSHSNQQIDKNTLYEKQNQTKTWMKVFLYSPRTMNWSLHLCCSSHKDLDVCSRWGFSLLYPPIFPSEMDVGIVTTVVIFSVCLHVGILETPQHCYGSIFSMSFELCYLPYCMHSNEGLWTCNKSAAAASSLSPSQPRVPFSQSRVCTLC